MKFDDASWHYGGDFPDGSPEEYGGTHIALFLKWCFIKGWASSMHLEEWPEDTKRVINGEMPATDFLFQYCDGKLTIEDFTDEGNNFARQYYGEDGLYLDDYADLFIDQMYLKGEADHDFETLSSIMNKRLESGILSKTQLQSQSKKSKPWWKVW